MSQKTLVPSKSAQKSVISSKPAGKTQRGDGDALVSIIVPVHNAEKYLARCLASLRAQTYSNLEIILVDDGSTDRSGELCTAAAAEDARIKVIHEPALGPSAARNAGLAEMSGDFVTFVDADDEVALDYVASLQALLTSSGSDLAICSFDEIFPDGAVRPFTPPRENPEFFDSATALARMLSEDGFMMSVWGKLYPRSFRDALKFPEGKIFEDVGTTYRALLRAQKIAFLPLPKYHYYQNPGSIIHHEFSFANLDLIALTDEMCREIATHFQLTSQPADDGTSSAITAPDSEHPALNAELETLALTLKARRMHARFSVLRQIVVFDPSTLSASDRARFFAERKKIVAYLKNHKDDILKNPTASRRDRLALRSLQLGLPVFKLAWKIYFHR